VVKYTPDIVVYTGDYLSDGNSYEIRELKKL